MIKSILTILIILLLLDSIWLYIIKDKYSEQVLQIQKEPLEANYLSALIVYLLIAYGLYYLTKDGDEKIKKAMVFGLVGYGIYDFTNGAIFKDWNFNLAIADTIWGSLLCGTTIYIFNKL
jgi:uncharacterized membrane protein